MGKSHSERLYPMTWRMFSKGPMSKGFSPGWVERMANVRGCCDGRVGGVADGQVFVVLEGSAGGEFLL